MILLLIANSLYSWRFNMAKTRFQSNRNQSDSKNNITWACICFWYSPASPSPASSNKRRLKLIEFNKYWLFMTSVACIGFWHSPYDCSHPLKPKLREVWAQEGEGCNTKGCYFTVRVLDTPTQVSTPLHKQQTQKSDKRSR